MPASNRRIKAFIFDVFGTIVDWRSGVAAVVGQTFKSKAIDYDANEFACAWRAEYDPAMERIRSGNRDYVALDILHRENLDSVLKKSGLENHFNEDERNQLNRAWEQLPPWPDSVAGLMRLKQNFIIAPCSNGSIALMTHLAKFAHLPWDCILGAEIAKDYKPSPTVYEKACQALQLEPSEVVMVAAHNSDLAAAHNCGLKTAFFVRPNEYGHDQQTDLCANEDWDFITKDLENLADLILS